MSIPIDLRHHISSDLPAVIEIEKEAFEYPWTKEEFVEALRQRNSVCLIASLVNSDVREVIGYIIYNNRKMRYTILNMAIKKNYRRMGIGSAIIDKMVYKLSYQRHDEIVARIRESNLPAQLFFKANAFKAECIEKQPYDNTDEDAYFMRYCKNPENRYVPRNRIAKFL